MAILKIKKQDGSWAVVGEPSAVKFTEQELTEEQKAQARENIGASSVGKPGTEEGAEIFNDYANNIASGKYSHAEGNNTTASGIDSHAEGIGTTASGRCSHAEGSVTSAKGFTAHAEGYVTHADHDYSHAGGRGTKTSAEYQTVIGKWNAPGQLGSLFVIGCGESNEERSNAFEVLDDGQAILPKADSSHISKLKHNNIITKGHLNQALDDFEDKIIPFYIQTTYNELKELRDSDKLIPGAFYKITDYECATTQSGTRAINNNLFSIMVQALGISTLSETGYAIKKNKLNIPIRYKIPGAQYDDIYEIYEISEQDNNEGNRVPVIMLANYYDDVAYYVDRYELDGVLYDRWRVIEGVKNNEIFYDWDFDSKKYLLTNIVTENGQFTISDKDEIIQYGVIYDDIESIYDEQQLEGKKDVIVKISHITDDQGNSIPVLYKNDEEDFPGQVDYEDEYRYVGRQMLGEEEYDAWYCGYGTFYSYMLTDIIVDDNGQFLSSIYNTAESLTVWDIKYCLDNNTTRFSWADEENGKGVIYYMKDEWNNECSYDFKNIQFERNAEWWEQHQDFVNEVENETGINLNNTDGWFYTFSQILEDGTIFDDSIAGQSYDNRIIWSKPNSDGLGSNIFFTHCYNNILTNCNNNTFGCYCNNNILKTDCARNTLGNYCNDNIFGVDCYNNTFGFSCYENAFGDCCYDNTFGNSCYFNIFGINCTDNIFRNDCYDNTFGNSCYLNVFGNGCYSNVFGINCNNNVFGNSYGDNTFGNSCQYNIFGPSEQEPIHFVAGIKCNSRCSYIKFLNTSTGDMTNLVQNITIGPGIKGQSGKYLELPVQRNAAPVVYEAPGTTHIILD